MSEKRKLIEVSQEFIVECDNPSCDYKVENKEGTFTGMESYDEYLNKPCPKCGENLLTEEDYQTAKKLFEIVEFLNDVFPDEYKTSEPTGVIGVKVHKGIHFSKANN